MKATRITIDGVEIPIDAGVELTEGSHQVVVFVAQREAPAPIVDVTLLSAALVERFTREKVFWRQFTIAAAIVDRKDSSVLPSLAAWLNHEDAADRYYAAHLLGDLRDPRGVPILASWLKDKEVSSIVPWALGEIGDKSAVGPLLDALDDDNPSLRVLAIYALETLNAKEAVPRLIALLGDHRKSNFGAQVSVAEAAKAAIAKLQ